MNSNDTGQFKDLVKFDNKSHVMDTKSIENKIVELFEKYKTHDTIDQRETIIKNASLVWIDNFTRTAEALDVAVDRLVGAPVYKIVNFLDDIFKHNIITMFINGCKRLSSDSFNIHHSALFILIIKNCMYKDARSTFELIKSKNSFRNDHEKQFVHDFISKLDKNEQSGLELMHSIFNDFAENYRAKQGDGELARIIKLLDDNHFSFIASFRPTL